MKSKSILHSVLGAALALSLPASAVAQDQTRPSRTDGAYSRLANGVVLGFTTTVYVNDVPLERQSQLTTMVNTRSNSISRILIDEQNGVWLGYDLEAEPQPDGKIRYTIKPLNEDTERRLKQEQFSAVDFWARARDLSARLSLPKTGTVENGWSLEIIVASNPSNRGEIGDRIRFGFGREPASEGRPSEPRDFGVDAVRMFLDRFRLNINGENVTGDGFNGAIGGPLVWVHVPGRGRYIFSLIPRDGYEFQKIGAVEGDKITFEIEGDHFELTSAGPIVLSGAESWNLWVLHDTLYTPPQSDRSDSEALQRCCFAGAASDLAALLAREPRSQSLRRPSTGSGKPGERPPDR